jgi:hypothetical protein
MELPVGEMAVAGFEIGVPGLEQLVGLREVHVCSPSGVT